MEIKEALLSQKQILSNLLEKYLYEFSFYDKTIPDKNGLYGYRYLDYYWKEKDRWPFLFWEEGYPIGFALINRHIEGQQKADYAMAEFFVLNGYRRKGVGYTAMKSLFNRFSGKWEIKYHAKNIASVSFWNRIAAACDPNYVHSISSAVFYNDGTRAEFLTVDSSKGLLVL